MNAKLIFILILVIIVFYFGFGAGSRLLKIKSAHYIVPPASEKDPNWIPVEMHAYIKQVFLKQENDLETIDELTRIIDERIPQLSAEIILENGWFTITIRESNFKDYHLLVALCSYINDKNTFGLCKHSIDEAQDYIVKLNSEGSLDHLIGSFRTNQNFAVYLPKSGQNPKGNISRTATFEIDFQEEISKIPSINLFPHDLSVV